MAADGEASKDLVVLADEQDPISQIAGDGQQTAAAAGERDREERLRQRDVVVDLAGIGVDVRDLLLKRARDADPNAVAVGVAQRNAEGAAQGHAANLAQRRGVEDAQRGLAMAGLEFDDPQAVARDDDSLGQGADYRDRTFGTANAPAGRERHDARRRKHAWAPDGHGQQARDDDPFHVHSPEVRSSLMRRGPAARGPARARASTPRAGLDP